MKKSCSFPNEKYDVQSNGQIEKSERDACCGFDQPRCICIHWVKGSDYADILVWCMRDEFGEEILSQVHRGAFRITEDVFVYIG